MSTSIYKSTSKWGSLDFTVSTVVDVASIVHDNAAELIEKDANEILIDGLTDKLKENIVTLLNLVNQVEDIAKREYKSKLDAAHRALNCRISASKIDSSVVFAYPTRDIKEIIECIVSGEHPSHLDIEATSTELLDEILEEVEPYLPEHTKVTGYVKEKL